MSQEITISNIEASNLDGIRYIQSAYTDYNSILKCRIVPYKLYQSIFKNSGITWCGSVLSLPTRLIIPMESRIGEFKLMPDNSTLKRLPWRPECAQVFGKFWKNGGFWPGCPRVFLESQITKVKAANLKLGIGFEFEFHLLHKETGSPLHCAPYSGELALQGENWTILTEMVDAMEELGIPVWQFHSESTEGQFEISIGPITGSIMEAADSFVLAKQTIYNIAAKHNITATFMPKLYEGQQGAGAHVHFSVLNASTGKPAPEGTIKHFIAGILDYLPSFQIILTPTMNSFLRLVPKSFPSVYQMVGTENKDGCIRLLRNKEGLIDRFELKTPDATTNPYFMLGAIIGCGLDGLQKKMILPDEILVDPMTLPEHERPPMLPTSLSEALSIFKTNPYIKELFGCETVQIIANLREYEHEIYNKLDDAEKIKYFTNIY